MEKDDEGSVIGNLSHFVDCDEVLSIIKSLKESNGDDRALEKVVERFYTIMDKYQEQPHLLDPHLGAMVGSLIRIAMDSSKGKKPVMHLAFNLLFILTKTRTFKVVIRHFPHEVSDLEPVLALLTEQDMNDLLTWQTRYILLLWLSMIVMLPFHMSRFDGKINLEHDGKKPVMERIINIGKLYLSTKDKPLDAAAYLLSRFIVRPDVKEHYLKEFINWCLDRMSNFDGSVLSRVGEMSSLALLFKHGKREDLLPHAGHVLTRIVDMNFMTTTVVRTVRKLYIKLVQRVGAKDRMTFLKPRIATWRYQRGSRSLESNLMVGNAQVPSQEQLFGKILNNESHDDEDYDIPEELEIIIQDLLNGLKDEIDIVRWSAAKGIGRVTNRLPKDLADDVASSVLELFDTRGTVSVWHGGLLALAELGRRGLLLPERLFQVVPIILKALVYDEQKGSYSVGNHVRDAACYVCWAFARCYEPDVMKPFVSDIAVSLVAVSVFDREIRCRRAASAAFQENVGRQGTFPHGIEIVTTADYFAVGNRDNAYLSVSVSIAQFEEYTKPLIDHLVDIKVNHWNAEIRELASLALRNLCSCASDYMAKTVLPKLIPMTVSPDLNARHGAISAVGEIAFALFEWHKDKLQLKEVLGLEVIEGIQNIVCTLQQRKLFRGLAGELMRLAVCRLIERTAQTHFEVEDDVVDSWQEIINDCLHKVQEKIRVAAVTALTPFCAEYYNRNKGEIRFQKGVSLVGTYIKELDCSEEHVRQGFCKALGALPAIFLREDSDRVVSALIMCATISEKDMKWTGARKEAIGALANVINILGLTSVNFSQLHSILECFFCGLRDYTISENAGDIGSFVRNAAMRGFEAVVKLMVSEQPRLVSEELCSRVMCGIAQQAVEKIDRTRGVAASIFYSLLHSEHPVPNIPHHEELLNIFSKESCAEITWSNASETFPKFVHLLSMDTYLYSVLLGFCISTGGLTEFLARSSLSALMDFLRSQEGRKRKTIVCDTFLKLFRDHQMVSLVTVPLMNTIDHLLSSGVFDDVIRDEDSTFAVGIIELLKMEMNKCKDPVKIMIGGSVLCDLLQCPPKCRTMALVRLSILLCHGFPRIRMDVASKLFAAVVTYEDVVSPECLDEFTSLLTETVWDEPIQVLRPIRNRLCQLLNIPEPVAIRK